MGAKRKKTVDDASNKLEGYSTRNQSSGSKKQAMDNSEKPTDEALTRKKQIICFISDAHVQLHNAIMKGIDAELKNISIGIKVHNVLDATYNILRQKHSGIMSNRIHQRNKRYSVMHFGQKNSIKHSDAEKLVIKAASKNNLKFKKFKPGDKRDWYESASFFMNNLTAFSLRKRELKLGREFLVFEKKNKKLRTLPIQFYGLKNMHQLVMDGCSYPPEKRVSMIPYLGPMTTLIEYASSKGGPFEGTWREAAKKVLATIPHLEYQINGIIDFIDRCSLSKLKLLCRAIGNLFLLSTTTNKMIMCPPPNVFANIFQMKEVKFDSETFTKDEMIEAFAFSGCGAFVFYRLMCSKEWQLNTEWDQVARGVVYHSMFGLFKEGMHNLEVITEEKSWLSWLELNFFQKQRNAMVTFTPIKQRYWSSEVTHVSPHFPIRDQDASPILPQDFFDKGKFFRALEALRKLYTVSFIADDSIELSEDLLSLGDTLEWRTNNWYNMDITPKHSGTSAEPLFRRPNLRFMLQLFDLIPSS